jgi:hypothetical protein
VATPPQAPAPAATAPPPSSGAPKEAAPRERPSGMAVPSAICLALAAGLLFLTLPRGFALGGTPLDLPVQGALMGLAVLAGAWGAFQARERRVALGSGLALLLLLPAYDPRAPVERLPAYLGVALLFLLHLEFALLHAKVARLARMPRAHLTHAGQRREVELATTASRIAASWPTNLALAGGLVLLALGLQVGLGNVAPPQVGQSVEWRGPFGLALAGAVVLGATGAFAWVRAQRASAGDAASPAAKAAEGGEATAAAAADAPR